MQLNNKMKTRGQNTYHIFSRLGKQRTLQRRESNQPGVKKCTTDSTISLDKRFDGNQAVDPSRVTPTKRKTKDKIQKWNKGNCKEVIHAFYMSLEKPIGSHN